MIWVSPVSPKERVGVRGDVTRGADVGGVHYEDEGWGHEPRNGGSLSGLKRVRDSFSPQSSCGEPALPAPGLQPTESDLGLAVQGSS